jgi:outer membrane receptor for Fe3+-dicitrate
MNIASLINKISAKVYQYGLYDMQQPGGLTDAQFDRKPDNRCVVVVCGTWNVFSLNFDTK